MGHISKKSKLNSDLSTIVICCDICAFLKNKNNIFALFGCVVVSICFDILFTEHVDNFSCAVGRQDHVFLAVIYQVDSKTPTQKNMFTVWIKSLGIQWIPLIKACVCTFDPNGTNPICRWSVVWKSWHRNKKLLGTGASELGARTLRSGLAVLLGASSY